MPDPKKEGLVPKAGHTLSEAMDIDTAGQCNAEGPKSEAMRKLDLSSGVHGAGKKFPRT